MFNRTLLNYGLWSILAAGAITYLLYGAQHPGAVKAGHTGCGARCVARAGCHDHPHGSVERKCLLGDARRARFQPAVHAAGVVGLRPAAMEAPYPAKEAPIKLSALNLLST